MPQEQDNVALARKQLEALQTEASKSKKVGSNPSAVIGNATSLMRTLDTALAKGANAPMVDIAQQAVDTLEPLELKQLAKQFETMRQIAAGEREPLGRSY